MTPKPNWNRSPERDAAGLEAWRCEDGLLHYAKPMTDNERLAWASLRHAAPTIAVGGVEGVPATTPSRRCGGTRWSKLHEAGNGG